MAAMGALTESEIFDCLAENCRLAAESCEKLARLPRKGPSFRALAFGDDCQLALIEGCCRQASAWREDTRWLPIGLFVNEIRKRAGEWLRGVKVGDGPRRRLPPGELHPLFVMAAEKLRAVEAKAIEFRDKATGIKGMILPEMLPAPFRETRPHAVLLPPGMAKTAGGLIIPAGAMRQ